jgi:anaerobic ribonucleoside-triphosphate reductase activating protein
MFKDPLRILKIYRETISDGIGLRYSIYLSGCKHACKGCHNSDSWDPSLGTLLTREWVDEMIADINRNPLLDGITLSGGDPFFYPESLLVLLKELKAGTGLNIWCYTGYTFEEVSKKDILKPCLEYIDVLVDGPFVQSLYDPSLQFRGSTNQGIKKVTPLLYPTACRL